MPHPLDDTIVAASSPPGGAARAIIRLSGPDLPAILGRQFRGDRGLELTDIRHPLAVDGTLELPARVPCSLYLWPDTRSYTGAPVAEVHLPGSPPLVEMAVRAFCRSGARLAEPGEFTLRAFLAGRIDLTRAEAVLGVVDAVDSHQLDAALTQLAGGLSGPLERLRDELLDLLAHLEAGFDFADEELPFITAEQLDEQLAAAAVAVEAVARQLATRGETADPTRAVLVGSPNTGKSSLFNALAGTPAALVAAAPGTTRDYLVAELELEGARCRLVDTAGAEPVEDGLAGEVDRAAQAMTRQQHRLAHVRLLCLDATRPLNDWERQELARPCPAERLILLTKTDRPPRTDFAGEAVSTSVVTGAGIEALRRQLRKAVLAAGNPAAGAVAGTAARSGESIRQAADCLTRARRLARDGDGEELVAAEIRTALEGVGRVVGAVYTEDVLERIFSRFCIGK